MRWWKRKTKPNSNSIERAQLEHSNVWLTNCHPISACEGRACSLHNRTDHHMRPWMQGYRWDRGIVERICPHGVGHPDPDNPPWVNGIHGCDGCCIPPDKGKREVME